jgi:hypothetical protein
MRDWNKPNTETIAEEMSDFDNDEKGSSETMSQVKSEEESEDNNRNDILDDSGEGELLSRSVSSEDSKNE